MRAFLRTAGVAVALATLVAGLLGLSSAGASASAKPAAVRPMTANSPFYNGHDGRCLDEDVASATHNGTKVQVWHCNGWNNQQWTYYSDHTIRSTHDGRCLDEDVASATHNGTKVQVWDCNGWDNQYWTWYSDGSIRNGHDGRCLDEDVSSATYDGTKVQVWDCNGWNNQYWSHP